MCLKIKTKKDYKKACAGRIRVYICTRKTDKAIGFIAEKRQKEVH